MMERFPVWLSVQRKGISDLSGPRVSTQEFAEGLVGSVRNIAAVDRK